jgi:transposase InsO family protein
MLFVERILEGERMSDLCREYGISRKTGYKLKERYERLGGAGLFDVSRRPHREPRRTPDAIRELLIQTRRTRPTWGPRKLLAWLGQHHPAVKLPAASTIGDILSREGLVQRRRRRKGASPYAHPLRTAAAANDIWCADYKGQFRLGSSRYCYPLTVTDQWSRYLLACEGFEAIESDSARAVFDDLFTRQGLPTAIRTDNGPPFASRGLFGLTKLSAWWLKLGIIPERIKPAHPEQNGRHERMHRTLKAETTRPPAANFLAQQERFDSFRETFNHDRPHEALGQRPPAVIYAPSTRRSSASGLLEYPLHDDVRTVARSGHVSVPRGRGQAVFISTALAGERVGIREIAQDQWLITFATLDLGWVDTRAVRFHAADIEEKPSEGMDGTNDIVLPMSPV